MTTTTPDNRKWLRERCSHRNCFGHLTEQSEMTLMVLDDLEKAERLVAFQERRIAILRNDAHKAIQYAEKMQTERDVLAAEWAAQQAAKGE